jgi:hypothetical protein
MDMTGPRRKSLKICQNVKKLEAISSETNPQNLGSDESESFAIFSETRANQIQIRIKLKKIIKKRNCGFLKKDLLKIWYVTK